MTEHLLDLSNHDGINSFPGEVLSKHDHVNILVNNAGVALAGNFDQVGLSDAKWLFDINFWEPIRLIKAFMYALRREPAAHIVNVSSLFGIMARPGQAFYCVAKFALRGFSESLRHELLGSDITLTVLYPGGVGTDIASSARIPQGLDPAEARLELHEFNKLRTPPEYAARQIAKSIERRDRCLLIWKRRLPGEATSAPVSCGLLGLQPANSISSTFVRAS